MGHFFHVRSGSENQPKYPEFRQIPLASCQIRPESGGHGVRIVSLNCPILALHRQKVWRNLLTSTTEWDYGSDYGHFQKLNGSMDWKRLHPRYFYSCKEGFKVGSKSKRTERGILSCAEKASRFSNEGALIPRSIRLKKSTDIPRSSANCSWLNFLSNLIALRRRPNFSRRLCT
jgi:hypothetical protein